MIVMMAMIIVTMKQIGGGGGRRNSIVAIGITTNCIVVFVVVAMYDIHSPYHTTVGSGLTVRCRCCVTPAICIIEVTLLPVFLSQFA